MPPASRAGASYRAVLTLPHARELFVASMLARLSYAVLALPLLLSLREATGSFAVAGTATGLFGLLTGVLGPLRARIVGRHRSVLVALATGYALALAAIAVAGAHHLAPVSAIGLAVLAGLFPPPVGSIMRTLWGTLTPDEAWRRRALSLDTVAESTTYALGPVISGAAITLWSAPVALAGVAALVITGFTAMAVALRRAPAALRAGVSSAGVRQRFLRLAGFAPMLVVLFGAGAALAVEEIAVVATWGAAVAGVLMALLSVGGVLGGLGYGRYRWRGPAGRRLLALAAAGAVAYAVPAALRSVPTAAVALILAGAFADTLLVTAYVLVDDLVPAGARTEGGAWLSMSYNLGVALGAGVGGVLVDGPGPGAAFVAASVALGAGTLIAAGWRSPLRRPLVATCR